MYKVVSDILGCLKKRTRIKGGNEVKEGMGLMIKKQGKIQWFIGITADLFQCGTYLLQSAPPHL